MAIPTVGDEGVEADRAAEERLKRTKESAQRNLRIDHDDSDARRSEIKNREYSDDSLDKVMATAPTKKSEKKGRRNAPVLFLFLLLLFLFLLRLFFLLLHCISSCGFFPSVSSQALFLSLQSQGATASSATTKHYGLYSSHCHNNLGVIYTARAPTHHVYKCHDHSADNRDNAHDC